MSDDNVRQFPLHRHLATLGLTASSATLESELDPSNPRADSLRGLLLERRRLIEKYTSSDGSVREVERAIADRLEELST